MQRWLAGGSCKEVEQEKEKACAKRMAEEGEKEKHFENI
jgi:hypothetical protein